RRDPIPHLSGISQRSKDSVGVSRGKDCCLRGVVHVRVLPASDGRIDRALQNVSPRRHIRRPSGAADRPAQLIPEISKAGVSWRGGIYSVTPQWHILGEQRGSLLRAPLAKFTPRFPRVRSWAV